MNWEEARVKVMKDNPEAMPQYLEYPVKDRKSWESQRKRLDPCSGERFPDGRNILSDRTVVNWPLKKEL